MHDPRSSLREILQGARFSPSPWVTQILKQVAKFSSSFNALRQVDSYDRFAHQQAILAFQEKANPLASLIDRQQEAFKIREDLLPQMVRVLENSDIVRATPAKDLTLLGTAIARELSNWAEICDHHANYQQQVPPRDLKELQEIFSTTASKMSFSHNTQVILRTKAACEELAASLLSLTNPLEIMKHPEKFLTFQPGAEAFDVIGTLDGVLLDAYRTRQFIYGVPLAVKELERRFPGDQEIRIADIGAGAFGFLGLLALSSPRVKIEFVELNPQSALMLETLVRNLGLEERVKITVTDAFKWQPEKPVHGILSETMAAALFMEPFARLIPVVRQHLIPGGLIVPEKVSLKLLMLNENPATQPEIQTEPMSPIFPTVLKNKATAYVFSDQLPTFNFISTQTNSSKAEFIVDLTNLPLGKHQLWIGTDVTVFDNYKILPNQSQITLELPLICHQGGKRGILLFTHAATCHSKLKVTYDLGLADLNVSLDFLS